jgi:hypothetical protein
MRRFAAVVALSLLAGGGTALANGRPPGTSTIVFEKGNDQNIISGQTFGLLVSQDGGTTWQWMCESAVGYSGQYDPIYSYGASGTVFATTFRGLKAMRDRCSFDPVEATGCTPGDGSADFCALEHDDKCTFVSTNTLDSSSDVFYAAADPSDGQVYESTDDGMTFPLVAAPGQNNDWWESIAIAPSNSQIIYLAGYRLENGNPKQFLMLGSTDGGANYMPLPGLADITSASNSIMDIVAIDHADPLTFFVTVTVEDKIHFGLWKTVDGGQHFTEVLQLADRMAAALRSNGDLVVGTATSGTQVSHDKGVNWSPVTGAPHINCLSENSAGELWACTANFGSMSIPSDDAAIMKTTDLVTWTKVLRYQDITGPVTCPSGTKQQDCCVAQQWCIVRDQLGVVANVTDCALASGDGPPAADVTPPKGKGCCDTGGGAPAGSLALGTVVAMLVSRRRRRR